MRLNDIAQVRAQTIAARMRPNVRQPGQPRWSRAATTIDARAKGSAKTVCEKRTKDSHLLMNENIERRTSKFQPPGQEGYALAPGILCFCFTAFCWAVRMLDM